MNRHTSVSRLLKIFGLFIVLSLSVGCGTETDPPAPSENPCTGLNCPSDDENNQGGCQNRLDCPGGQVCRNGSCQQPQSVECQSNEECPGVEICVQKECQAPDQPDTGDDDEETRQPDTRDTSDETSGGEDIEQNEETTDETPTCLNGCFVDQSKTNCVEGTSAQNCGANGDVCTECGSDQVCAEGECKDKPSCEPSNCDGCCKNGDCLDGDTLNACGTGGKQCQTCDSVQNCQDGSCVTPCNSQTCEDGCCTDDGTCMSGDLDGACGVDGESCNDCTGPNELCALDGDCRTVSCSSSCDGCCDSSGNCVSKQNVDGQACGQNGNACVNCGAGFSCANGGCAIKSGSKWDVRVVSADIPSSDADGASWDPFGGAPDPYVDVVTATASGETSVKDDTLDPVWVGFGGTGERVIEAVEASEITNLPVTIKDSDTNPDDVISDCVISVQLDDFRSSSSVVKSCSPISSGNDQVTSDVNLKIEHNPNP